MAVSIITPVFNRFDLTEKFIKSVEPLLRDGDELIIIDNASTDGTMSKMLQIVGSNKQIHYKRSQENVGFGEGNNLGADIAKNDILIFISNDVVVMGDFITPTENVIINNMESGIKPFVGHRIINWNSGWNGVWESENNITKEYHKIPLIFYLQGYYLALHRVSFFSVGGFDRQIFIDYDDVDLAFKLTQSGHEFVVLPQLPISHESSGNSFIGLSEARQTITLRSMERFGKKYGFRMVK